MYLLSYQYKYVCSRPDALASLRSRGNVRRATRTVSRRRRETVLAASYRSYPLGAVLSPVRATKRRTPSRTAPPESAEFGVLLARVRPFRPPFRRTDSRSGSHVLPTACRLPDRSTNELPIDLGSNYRLPELHSETVYVDERTPTPLTRTVPVAASKEGRIDDRTLTSITAPRPPSLASTAAGRSPVRGGRTRDRVRPGSPERRECPVRRDVTATPSTHRGCWEPPPVSRRTGVAGHQYTVATVPLSLPCIAGSV